VLVKEIFGWREFANRRELAGCVGLAPTPYASGDSEIEQGISKAGNRQVRAMLVEQAWKWLQLQPDSAMTKWFNRRFASGGKRMRRVGIVALARRLVIALWRYLKHGEIPAEWLNATNAIAIHGLSMNQGRRARTGSGSLQRDRPQRWGAPITGVCQRTVRVCCMWCWTPASDTDRSSSEHWLEPSSYPDLGSARCLRSCP
jgi:hypothetical protein